MGYAPETMLLTGNTASNTAPTLDTDGVGYGDGKRSFRACVCAAFQSDTLTTEDVDLVVWGYLRGPTPRWVQVDNLTGLQSQTSKVKHFSIAKPELYNRLFLQTTWNTTPGTPVPVDAFIVEYYEE